MSLRTNILLWNQKHGTRQTPKRGSHRNNVGASTQETRRRRERELLKMRFGLEGVASATNTVVVVVGEEWILRTRDSQEEAFRIEIGREEGMNDYKGREGESSVVVVRKRFKEKQQPCPSTRPIINQQHRRSASLPNTQYGSFSLFIPYTSAFHFFFSFIKEKKSSMSNVAFTHICMHELNVAFLFFMVWCGNHGIEGCIKLFFFPLN